MGRAWDLLEVVGGDNNDKGNTIIPLMDTTTIYQSPALCSLLLIPILSLEDAIYNYPVFIIYQGFQGSERLGDFPKFTSW